jgi:hypothetical protein
MEEFLMLLGHPAAIPGLLFLMVVVLGWVANSISVQKTIGTSINMDYDTRNKMDNIARSLSDVNIELSKLNDILLEKWQLDEKMEVKWKKERQEILERLEKEREGK